MQLVREQAERELSCWGKFADWPTPNKTCSSANEWDFRCHPTVSSQAAASRFRAGSP